MPGNLLNAAQVVKGFRVDWLDIVPNINLAVQSRGLNLIILPNIIKQLRMFCLKSDCAWRMPVIQSLAPQGSRLRGSTYGCNKPVINGFIKPALNFTVSMY